MSEAKYRKYYKTIKGDMFWGKCEDVIQDYCCSADFKPVNLLFTSPPFPLNRKKQYGNINGEDYINWISSLSTIFSKVLADDGSIVIELGNAWESGLPVTSTLPIETLLRFKTSGGFYLCQEFIYYNPAKLPSPVEWVNKKRIRVKDSFSRLWWLSKTPFPKANNRNVQLGYSNKMNKLIATGSYNSGKRPSEYTIGKNSFAKNNGGSIPPNVLVAANTSSSDDYISYCKANNHIIHPARMPSLLPEFFIRLLTDEDDIVLDPFSGSNTTGSVAENLNRRWISIEASEEYIKGSIGRFSNIDFVIE